MTQGEQEALWNLTPQLQSLQDGVRVAGGGLDSGGPGAATEQLEGGREVEAAPTPSRHQILAAWLAFLSTCPHSMSGGQQTFRPVSLHHRPPPIIGSQVDPEP